MRTRTLLPLLLSSVFPSCDSVDVGRPDDDPNPPKLLRILIQDGDSGVIVDLLDTGPEIACGDTNPCPAGTAGLVPECDITDEVNHTGKCVDPLNPMNTPVPVGTGATQIRLVLSKTLHQDTLKLGTDPDTHLPTYELADMSVIKVLDPSGMEVSGVKDFDPTGGSAVDTADPFGEPLGPALLFTPDGPFTPGAKYKLVVDPTKVKDKNGKAMTADIHGPIPASYDFTVESLHANKVTPDIAKTPTIAPNDVIQVAVNADLDETSAMATVKDMAGMTVMGVVAYLDRGKDKTKCKANKQLLDVFIADMTGMPTAWAEGSYTITITVKSADSPQATIDTLSGAFNVKAPAGDPAKDASAVENHPLPAQCMAPSTDMAMPVDMSMTD